MQDFKLIKEFPNYSITNFGNVKNNKTGRILKPGITIDNHAMVNLRLNKKTFSKGVHVLVANTFIDLPQNDKIVDHIDGNGLNNDVNNLRYSTYSQNNCNAQLSSKNTSGFKGVSFNKPINKWIAHISINGIQTHLGCFDHKEDALKARLKKSVEIQGEFINKCELIQIKRLELDQELEELEKELQKLIDN